MAEEKYDIDQIDRYLDQEMDEGERAAFEAQLRQNANLADRFEERRLVYVAAWLAGEDQERDELRKLGKKLLNEGTTAIPMYRRSWFQISIAAAVAMLMLIVWSLQTKEQFGEILYADAIEKNPPSLSIDNSDLIDTSNPTRNGDDQLPSDTLIEAMQDAQLTENYGEVAIYLEKIGERNPEARHLAYYLGMALMMDGQYASAAEQLVQIEAGTRYADQAHWYVALTLLQLGRIDQAREWLEQLILRDRFFRAESAQEILEQLKEEK